MATPRAIKTTTNYNEFFFQTNEIWQDVSHSLPFQLCKKKKYIKETNAIFSVQTHVLAITTVAAAHFWGEWNFVLSLFSETTDKQTKHTHIRGSQRMRRRGAWHS